MTDNNGFEWTAEIENNSENTSLIPTKDSSVLADTLNSLILDGDFQAVKDFLKEKAFTGRNIPIINIIRIVRITSRYFIKFTHFFTSNFCIFICAI